MIRRNALVSVIKFVFSFFHAHIAMSLGDLSIYYLCQFWKFATLNPASDICYCTNLASQCRKLRRENIHILFDWITQVGTIPSHRPIVRLIVMFYSHMTLQGELTKHVLICISWPSQQSSAVFLAGVITEPEQGSSSNHFLVWCSWAISLKLWTSVFSSAWRSWNTQRWVRLASFSFRPHNLDRLRTWF